MAAASTPFEFVHMPERKSKASIEFGNRNACYVGLGIRLAFRAVRLLLDFASGFADRDEGVGFK